MRKLKLDGKGADGKGRVAGTRLDHVLADELPRALGQPVSRSLGRKLIIAGAVYLNGQRVRIASKPIRSDARLEVWWDDARIEKSAAEKTAHFEVDPTWILFEDEHTLFVNKPAGLPTQPTLDDARANLYALVKSYLSKREGIHEAYLGLHHRLDRDTSGVIVFAKTQAANPGFARAFQEHQVRKTYSALTVPGRGPGQASCPDTWQIDNHLGRDRKARGKAARYTAVRSGGDRAITDFKVLERGAQGLYVAARPLTGRTHQIRVHLSEYGLPIVGDEFYGGPACEEGRFMLHASELELPHPLYAERIMKVVSPAPEDFKRCWKRLKS